MIESSFIDVSSLSYTYMKGTPYETKALNRVDFTANKGEIVGIIGPTGCGKSTLIQHFNGLLRPESGKVIVDGLDLNVSEVNLRDLRKKVGLVFQYPEYQLFEETVAADIAFGPRQIGFAEDEIGIRVKESMSLMGLDPSMADRSPFSLSGGEMRRVAIAGVLAMKPKALVLDEPVAGLDPLTRKKMLDMIVNLNRKEKITVILVSHSMDEIVEIASKIVVMNEGMVIASGNAGEVFSNSKVIDSARLLLPQCTELMVRLSELGLPVRHDLYTIEACTDEISSLFK